MNFPHLTTNRFELKEIKPSDSKAIFDIFSNPEVVKYYDLAPFTHISQAENLIQFFRKRFDNGTGIRWGIFYHGDNQCLGTCGFNSWDKNMRSASLGYDLNKNYWRQGIASEALQTIIGNAFNDEEPFGIINRIQADTIPGNVASEKVLLKLGFVEEGLRRQSGYWKNQYHDLKCFGLLKEEYNFI